MANGDPRKYVESLQYALPEVKIDRLRSLETVEGLITASENEASAFVSGGSLIAFTAHVKGQNRSDVLNSTLLAQLVADKLYSKEKEMVEWYRKYQEVLNNIGWNLQEFNFGEYESTESAFSIDQALLEILAGALTGTGQLALLKQTFEAFKALGEDDSRMRMFENSAHKLNKSAFQVALATENNDAVAIAFGATYFESQTKARRILFAKFDKEKTQVYSSSVVGVLNPGIYEQVRDAVNQKIGKHTQDYVAKLPDLGL